MSVRTKVLALLLGLLVFLAAAASVSVVMRARAETALSRVTQRDVPLLALSTRVTAVHLEQAMRLERALATASRSGPGAEAALRETRRAFEADAARIWNRLRDAVAFAQSAADAGDPDARLRLDGVIRIDLAHNAYAECVREAFDWIEAGDLASARLSVLKANEARTELGIVLGDVLEGSAQSAAAASSLARRDAEIADAVMWLLLLLGLGAAAGVFAVVIRMVSEMRTLSGLLPICAQCKRIRDDQGYWNQLESYLQNHSDAEFTHGLCRDCQGAMHDQILRKREAEAPA